jgi:peptidoglycan/xylan/chitin deacetylase (PgdA/CDA1 family)
VRSDEPTSDTMKLLDLRRSLKIGVSLTYYLIREIGRLVLRVLGQQPRERLTILYYHEVTADCRSNFARQMEALRRKALIVPASYRGALPSARKCVAITFDDAFQSVAENALPELGKHSFHATIFVPVGWLGQTPGWTMEPRESGSVDVPELSEVVMSAEQLSGLSRSLVSLGAHSLSHPLLPELEAERAREEIERSRALLAEVSGRDVLEFAFPYGAHNEATVAMCRAALYETAYSIIPEEVDTTSQGFLRGRTKTEPSDGPLEFFLKFNGAYEWMRYGVAYKRSLRSTLSAIRGTAPAAPKAC